MHSFGFLTNTKMTAEEIAKLTAGQFVGSSATYAGLPTVGTDGNPVSFGDVAKLGPMDDGTFEAGYYTWDGAAWNLVLNDFTYDEVLEYVGSTDLQVIAGLDENRFLSNKQAKTYYALKNGNETVIFAVAEPEKDSSNALPADAFSPEGISDADLGLRFNSGAHEPALVHVGDAIIWDTVSKVVDLIRARAELVSKTILVNGTLQEEDFDGNRTTLLPKVKIENDLSFTPNGTSSGIITATDLLASIRASLSIDLVQPSGTNTLQARSPSGVLIDIFTVDTSLLSSVRKFADVASFPALGKDTDIYLALDTAIIYQWDASLDTPAYVEMSSTHDGVTTNVTSEAEMNAIVDPRHGDLVKLETLLTNQVWIFDGTEWLMIAEDQKVFDYEAEIVVTGPGLIMNASGTNVEIVTVASPPKPYITGTAYVPSGTYPETVKVYGKNITRMAYTGGVLESVDITKGDLITNIVGMFQGEVNLVSCNIEPSITSGIENFTTMFKNCSSLANIPLLDTSSAKFLTSVADGCTSITTFPLWDTANVQGINNAWQNCSSLESFPALDFSSVFQMDFAWAGCSALLSFDITSFPSLGSMRYAWMRCTSLTSFPAINYPQVNNMTGAWFECVNIESHPGVYGPNVLYADSLFYRIGKSALSCTVGDVTLNQAVLATSLFLDAKKLTSVGNLTIPKVANVSNMFEECRALQSVGNIDISAATDASAFFYFCESLVTLGTITSGPALADASFMFYRCLLLPTLPLFDTSSVTNMDSTFADCRSITIAPAYDTSSVQNFTRTFYRCLALLEVDDTFSVVSATDMTSTFEGCASLEGSPDLDLLTVTSLNATWKGCSSLGAFPSFDASTVASFTNTWNGCTAITVFPLIDTSSATNLEGAWKNCISLLDFPLISTSLVTNFSNTWEGTTSMTNFPIIDTSSGTNFFSTWKESGIIIFPALNFSSATDMMYTVSRCPNLQAVNMNPAGFPNLSILYETFAFNPSLLSFNAVGFTALTEIRAAWQGCTAMTNFTGDGFFLLDKVFYGWTDCSSLPSFPLIPMPLVTNLFNAWNGCNSMTTIGDYDFSNVTDFTEAFKGCSSLAAFNVDMPIGSAVAVINMFLGATSLYCIKNIDTTLAGSTLGMFTGCANLTAPNTTEQAAILAGSAYVNPAPCVSGV